MTDEAPKSLAAALVELQRKLPTIAKTQTANVRTEKGSYSYDYADLSDVSEAVLPLLADVGLAWMCRPTVKPDGAFVLAYCLLHVSGDREEGEYPLPKTGTPQTIGGHITYARRYALCAVTGVAPKGDDDDAQAAEQAGTAQRRQRTQRQQQPAEQAAADKPAEQQQTRTAARSNRRAAAPHPPLPGEDGYEQSRPAGDGITPEQLKKLHTVLSGYGIGDREEKLDIARRILRQPDLASSTALSKADAITLIDRLEKAGEHAGGFSGYLAELLAATEDTDQSREDTP